MEGELVGGWRTHSSLAAPPRSYEDRTLFLYVGRERQEQVPLSGCGHDPVWIFCNSALERQGSADIHQLPHGLCPRKLRDMGASTSLSGPLEQLRAVQEKGAALSTSSHAHVGVNVGVNMFHSAVTNS